jgi:D-beta-D-heptose 7-phosphate kinase/D-beta-D-heptose 1-phosphate adenosyltransferase
MKSKVKKRDELIEIAKGLRKKGKKIVFTNGCFDILHVGHIRLLREAKKLGDILIVGLNSDSSAKMIKGEGRPIVPQYERAEILSALEMIDYVTFFDETDPHLTISLILPNVLVKGSDWPEDGIVGRDVVESHGGKVVRVVLLEGRSTSSLIDRIRQTGVS